MRLLNRLVVAIMAVAGSAMAVQAFADNSLPKRARVTGWDQLVEASHTSDGTERARGGPLRFEGPMGAQAVSHKNYQYIVYYTARDRSIPRAQAFSQVVVARRKLGSFNWEHATLQGYQIRSDDAHNRQTIGISSGDGVIHIAFDHHNNPKMNYAATLPDVATAPEAVVWDDSVFRYAVNLGGDPAVNLNVTYPAFKAFPGGNLMVYFRTGGSYGGDMRVARYDAQTGKWGKVHAVSTRHGTYQGLETTRGPYLADGMQVGSDGSLHAAWIFREKPCDYTTKSRSEIFCNHGLFYARSRDEGLTWLRADGSLIANTMNGETISIDNIGGPVMEVPKGLGPSNPSITSTIDPLTGDMHVLLEHLPKPGAPKAFYYHYQSSVDGTWTRTQTNFSGASTTLAVLGDRLYAFVGRTNGQIYYAERADGFSKWKRMPIDLDRGRIFDPKGGYITWDISNLPQGGVSLIWHQEPTVTGVSSPLQVFDIALE